MAVCFQGPGRFQCVRVHVVPSRPRLRVTPTPVLTRVTVQFGACLARLAPSRAAAQLSSVARNHQVATRFCPLFSEVPPS